MAFAQTVWYFGLSLLVWSATAFAQTDREDYVSTASFVIGTHRPSSTASTPETRAANTRNFLDKLDDSQRQRASFPLNSPERREWTNLPPSPNAKGLRFRELNEEQVKAACDLMAVIFSERGYQKMCHIMLADDQLLSGGRPHSSLGTENFALLIFGEPSETEPWAFQLDGHHIGVNLTFQGDEITMSPSFIGTQPEAFKIDDQDYRPLTDEIDEAYRLVNLLNDEQRKSAVINPRRGVMIAGPGADGRIPPTKGVSCQTFTEEQKQSLIKLICAWVNDLPGEHAEREMERLTSEIDQMYFSWNGALTARSDISYTIQGPTLIIEFTCQGAADNPLDHIHTMYRNPTSEYGKLEIAQ
jgi:hypothetical protein